MVEANPGPRAEWQEAQEMYWPQLEGQICDSVSRSRVQCHIPPWALQDVDASACLMPTDLYPRLGGLPDLRQPEAEGAAAEEGRAAGAARR